VRLLLVGLVCAAALAGCGGGGGEHFEGADVKEWTGSACTAIRTWRDDVKARANDRARRVSESSSASQARNEVTCDDLQCKI
jgi:hypothetical protein